MGSQTTLSTLAITLLLVLPLALAIEVDEDVADAPAPALVGPPYGLGSADPWVDARGDTMFGNLDVLGAVTASEIFSKGTMYVNYDGPDESSYLCYYDGSSRCGRSISWTDHTSRFLISADIFVMGTVIQSSTGRLKENVETLDGALATVQQLRGVEYDWKTDGRHDIGFIAEEVAEVVPDIVSSDENGEVDGIDYGRMSALLVEAVKEQQAELDAKDAKIAQMEERLSALEEGRAPAGFAMPWLTAALGALALLGVGAVGLAWARKP